MLRRGELVGIFPEGTRGHDGQEQKAHEGIALIASMAAADVLPVRLWGTSEISPPGSKRWHFPRVTLAFGEPLSLRDARYEGLEKTERYRRFARDCLEAIYAIELPAEREGRS
jgi:1-acyl-sn-glycerol-3-phosphate acyltransferase